VLFRSRMSSLTANNTTNQPRLKPIPSTVIERWSHELANKRQYLGFARSVEDDVVIAHQKLTQLRENIRIELNNLKAIVGAKASVPKEQVYPKFDSLASMWLSLWEVFLLIKARAKTYDVLSKYKASYRDTLTDTAISAIPDIAASLPAVLLGAGARVAKVTTTAAFPTSPLARHGSSDSLDADAKAEEKVSSKGRGHTGTGTGASAKASSSRRGDVESKGLAANWTEAVENLTTEDEPKGDEAIASDDAPATDAVLLSVSNTPDFMLLPLELQGFCPWTMATCRGLLVPGKPSLGVVRFENQYFVFDNQVAVQEFLKTPALFIQAVRDIAMANPEFIHLLRLQQQFPTASIAKLLERSDFDHLPGSSAMMKDASTETPTHFVEKRIDVNYHWNEWELRRRALKVANLKNCSTVAQQTNFSDFRRDNSSQVYLPRDKDTQTRRSKGTNPPIKTTYVTGFRGLPDSKNESSAVSKYVKPDAKQDKAQSRVVTLTLDL